MIFISHRKTDEQQARQLAEILKVYNVSYYLDVLDPSVKSASDLTDHIMSTLDKCSHVIVLFSSSTAGSLWVPFELGAAYKGGKGIGTYLLDIISTPEYLNAFPKMKNSKDLEQFIEEYKKDQMLMKSQRSIIQNESTAKSFIQRVKTRLHQ